MEKILFMKKNLFFILFLLLISTTKSFADIKSGSPNLFVESEPTSQPISKNLAKSLDILEKKYPHQFAIYKSPRFQTIGKGVKEYKHTIYHYGKGQDEVTERITQVGDSVFYLSPEIVVENQYTGEKRINYDDLPPNDDMICAWQFMNDSTLFFASKSKNLIAIIQPSFYVYKKYKPYLNPRIFNGKKIKHFFFFGGPDEFILDNEVKILTKDGFVKLDNNRFFIPDNTGETGSFYKWDKYFLNIVRCAQKIKVEGSVPGIEILSVHPTDYITKAIRNDNKRIYLEYSNGGKVKVLLNKGEERGEAYDGEIIRYNGRCKIKMDGDKPDLVYYIESGPWAGIAFNNLSPSKVLYWWDPLSEIYLDSRSYLFKPDGSMKRHFNWGIGFFINRAKGKTNLSKEEKEAIAKRKVMIKKYGQKMTDDAIAGKIYQGMPYNLIEEAGVYEYSLFRGYVEFSRKMPFGSKSDYLAAKAEFDGFKKVGRVTFVAPVDMSF